MSFSRKIKIALLFPEEYPRETKLVEIWNNRMKHVEIREQWGRRGNIMEKAFYNTELDRVIMFIENDTINCSYYFIWDAFSDYIGFKNTSEFIVSMVEYTFNIKCYNADFRSSGGI